MKSFSREVGRINMEVEKKLNLHLEGDTNIYILEEMHNKLLKKYGEKYEKLCDEFRKILKKPHYVRVTDEETNFIYLTILLKNGIVMPYQLTFTKKDGRYIMDHFGYLSLNDLKIIDSIYPFVKI